MTYDVVLEENESKRFQATILGWPNCNGTGATRELALEKLRSTVQERLAKAEIVQLEIDVPQAHRAGSSLSLKANPLFDEAQEHIEAYRRELDAEEAE